MKLMKLTDKEKLILFDFLGYYVEEGIIISNDTNKPKICPFTNKPVEFDKASIMPGSAIIFNTTPLSLAEYFEYIEPKEEEKINVK